MTLKQTAETIAAHALDATDNQYVEAISCIKLAELLLRDQLEEIEERARVIADLLLGGRIEEAKAMAADYGLELTWDPEAQHT